MTVGIETLRFYVPDYYLRLNELAASRQVDPNKFRHGLGQELMAVAPPDEDVVTLAANAAVRALHGIDRARLGAVIVGTEGGVDQSKSAAAFLHGLLDLPSTCQVFEIKQACCAGTLALQQALNHVQLDPDRKVLIVASDVARYELGSAAESTQGAGACAMVVSATPRVLAVQPVFGTHTKEVMDFWRPSYRSAAVVDGRLSIEMYLQALEQSWHDYRHRSGLELTDFARFCCHLPFSRIAAKARLRLRQAAGMMNGSTRRLDLDDVTAYNRVIGNTYTASLYISLACLLETGADDLAGERVALYSYGSGSMGLFFAATVLPGYRRYTDADGHDRMLAGRRAVDLADYEAWHAHGLPTDGSEARLPVFSRGPFRLSGMNAHRRLYTRTDPDGAAAADAVTAGKACFSARSGSGH